MDHGTKKPNLGGTYGNVNQLGVISVKAGSSLPKHPGTVTRGPGNNKPRIHLVSSKGKIPAEVVSRALAERQKTLRMVNPSGSNGSQTDPNLRGAHTSMPKGVKPYTVKPHTGLT